MALRVCDPQLVLGFLLLSVTRRLAGTLSL